MVQFSYAHIPAYPLAESIRLIKVADELGIYAAYACDETWWKDMWLLFAAAARETSADPAWAQCHPCDSP